MLLTLWSPSVIYMCFQFYQRKYPKESFRVHYERSIYSESILNGILCTYYGIFYQNAIVDMIVLSHILSDFLYIYWFRPYDYYMVIHHLFTLNYLYMVLFYFSNPIASLGIGFAETTNIFFNVKLLLKSFHMKIHTVNTLFIYIFSIVRTSILPLLTGMELHRLFWNQWNFVHYNYFFTIFLLHNVGLHFVYKLSVHKIKYE